MNVQRFARAFRAIALRGSPTDIVPRGAVTERLDRGVPSLSVGYGVWQKAQTRRLLLSLPHVGHSIGTKNHPRA